LDRAARIAHRLDRRRRNERRRPRGRRDVRPGRQRKDGQRAAAALGDELDAEPHLDRLERQLLHAVSLQRAELRLRGPDGQRLAERAGRSLAERGLAERRRGARRAPLLVCLQSRSASSASAVRCMTFASSAMAPARLVFSSMYCIRSFGCRTTNTPLLPCVIDLRIRSINALSSSSSWTAPPSSSLRRSRRNVSRLSGTSIMIFENCLVLVRAS